MINEKLLPMNDYVVESSSDYHSGYIKYNNGTMIEWGEATVTDAIQTAHGPMYRSANPQIVNFSEKFGVNYPLIFLTAQANLNLAYFSGFINNGIDGFQFYPVGLTASSAATRYVKWLAIGRWK